MNTTSISINLKANIREQIWSIAIVADKAAAELHHNEYLVPLLTKHVEENRSGQFNTLSHSKNQISALGGPLKLQVCVLLLA